jgi:hypothetical protein
LITEKLARIDQLFNDSQNTLQNPNSLLRETYPNLHKLFHPELQNPEPSNDIDIVNVMKKSENGNHQVKNLQDLTDQAIREKYNKQNMKSTQVNDRFDEGVECPMVNASIQRTSNGIKMDVDKREPEIDDVIQQSDNDKSLGVAPKQLHILTDINCLNAEPNENEHESPRLPSIPKKHQREPTPNKKPTTKTPEPKSSEDVTPNFECPPSEQEFELYISESIAKYRQQRSNRYENTDPFNGKNLFELSVHNRGSRRSISNSMTTNNPINLLYSSLLSNPKYTDASPINGINPFSGMLSIKSTPTIKLTLQTSHHKKLRINGAPITSASKVVTSSNICDSKFPDLDYHAAESLARRSLTGDLEGVKINSDEELWNSSGVNTETEDDDIQYSIDNVIESTSSSDEDIATTDDTSTPNVMTHKNISSDLSEDQKVRIAEIQKKKNQKRMKRLKQLKKLKESSPSPKFKPSHHTLKPKRSILKVNSTPVQKRQPSINSFEFEIDDGSALSEVNSAFDRKIKSSISEFNAMGTIVGNSGDNDLESDTGVNRDVETRRRDSSDDININTNINTNDQGTKSIYKLKDLLISK